MKAILLACWVAFVAWGWFRLEPAVIPVPDASPDQACRANDEPALAAKKSMPTNWFLRAGDLREPGTNQAGVDVEGRYTACAVDVGELVSHGMTRSLPYVPDQDGKVTVPFVISAALAGEINAGVEVEIFDGVTSLVRAQVAAVQCAEACQALLQVSPAERQLLAPSRPGLFVMIRASSFE